MMLQGSNGSGLAMVGSENGSRVKAVKGSTGERYCLLMIGRFTKFLYLIIVDST